MASASLGRTHHAQVLTQTIDQLLAGKARVTAELAQSDARHAAALEPLHLRDSQVAPPLPPAQGQ